ncbi:hypothetical protein BC831DRAFT_181621 [Entophlyctis helioformis]|nr:hypothetical protein BC831DRAFT_181621 [Entophlyctis helioformis]
MLLDGCAVLKCHGQTVPQNTGGKEHYCGWCTFGCPYGEKQSTMLTWIKDASDDGAQLIEGAHATRIVHSNSQVRGVETLVDGSQRVMMSARRVVVCCGAIHTPALLLRSSIKNVHLGKHLKLHPIVAVHGIYPDRDIKPYEGSILTSCSDHVADLDGRGYGARIEVTSGHPSFIAMMMPWTSAADHKQRMLMYRHTATFVAVVRDDDSEGQVWADASTGQPRFNWAMSDKDARAAVAGLVHSLRLHIAAGASEVLTGQLGVPAFKRPAGAGAEQVLESAEFREYLGQVEAAGIKPNMVGVYGAHQMGTARMSTDAAQGVVDQHGESWDVRGLYVADTSVFPTACGVNPMVTAQSVAHSIAQFIKADLARDRAPNGDTTAPARMASRL